MNYFRVSVLLRDKRTRLDEHVVKLIEADSAWEADFEMWWQFISAKGYEHFEYRLLSAEPAPPPAPAKKPIPEWVLILGMLFGIPTAIVLLSLFWM